MSRTFEIIGAPFGLGANKDGSKNASSFLRKNGLNDLLETRGSSYWNTNIIDSGDVILPHYENKDTRIEKVKKFNQELKSRVVHSYMKGNTPIIIGGDHSITMATLSASVQYLEKQKKNPKVGIIWVDAHADINRLEKGNPHGKTLAVALGYVFSDLMKEFNISTSLSPQNIKYIGIRDLMPNEHKTVQEEGISIYGMENIDELGMKNVINQVIDELEKEVDGIFLSFDIDSCDGAIYTGCATPEIGGLTAREALCIVSEVSKSSKFMGMDIVEYSPEDDTDCKTNQLVIKLIDAVFGFRR